MDDTLSERFGIVLLPDAVIDREARDIASHIDGNQITFSDVRVPHMTLYHAHLLNVPNTLVNQCLAEVAACLPVEVKFTQVVPRNSKFIFWEIEKTSQLIELHEIGLKLAKYLDLTAAAPATKEGLRLSPEQEENVKKFGHPLVKGEWNPHITVGYLSDVTNQVTLEAVRSGSLIKASFAKIVDLGQAEPI